MIAPLNKYKEVLGLNRRNQEYVRPYNPPSAKKLADNKIATKRLLSRNGVGTPDIYKLIKNKEELMFLNWDSLPKSFVIKPNQGTGGNGILVFYGKKKGQQAWIRPNGDIMTKNDIILHMENILDGRFSMGNKKDIVIIEERVQSDPILKQYSYKGVPDIRIICFKGIPIMAMIRIPTKRSNGTANLHSGAICTGIDIATGITTNSMQMNTKSPLTDIYEDLEMTTDLKENKPLRGIHIPNWDNILEIALKCQKLSGLGYIGVDIALDVNKGPVVFELNARPGLGIQVANRAGLRPRLELVRDLNVKNYKHGIKLAKNLFGGEVEESIEAISGKKVVSLFEKVIIYNKNSTTKPKGKRKRRSEEDINTHAFIDTGYQTSRITTTMANRIGYINTTKYFNSLNVPQKFFTMEKAQKYIDENKEKLTSEENLLRVAKIINNGKIMIRPVIQITIKIADEIKDIEVVIEDDINYNVVIGRKDLKGYLIDTSNQF